MTTIEKITVKFQDGSEIEMTKDQFEELKRSFEKTIYHTWPWTTGTWTYPISTPWITYSTATADFNTRADITIDAAAAV